MPTYDEALRAVLHDPTASWWLKRAIADVLRRDCVDAVNDAEYLLKLLTDRLEAIQGKG